MCPICGRAFTLGSDIHGDCRKEQHERSLDSKFIRDLRRELQHRGVSERDFIAQAVKWLHK